MPSVKLVLDAEQNGLGEPFASAHAEGRLIHLNGPNDEIVISGLKDGMQGGKPSMMFGFQLPDGSVVLAETSWRLFAAAYKAFAGKFGQEDVSGLALEYDATGSGDRVRLDLVADDAPQFFECELCGARVDEEAGIEGAQRITQWIHRHFREKHPGRAVPTYGP